MAVIVPVVTALIITILTAFFSPIRKYLFGPTLRIVALKTITTEEGFHWQVLVTSTGIFSAERSIGCRVKITVHPIAEDDVLDEHTKLKPINFRNTQAIQNESICWARHGNPERLDIYPLDIEPVEPIFFHLSDNKIIIPSENGWSLKNGMDLIRLKPRNYTFHIVVTAENAHKGWADIEFRKSIKADDKSGPWATFCIRCNKLTGYRIPDIPPGVFDLRDAGSIDKIRYSKLRDQ